MEYMRARNSKLNSRHQKASNREMSYKSLKKAMSNVKMHPSFNEQSISFLLHLSQTQQRHFLLSLTLLCFSFLTCFPTLTLLEQKWKILHLPYLRVYKKRLQVKSNSFDTQQNNFMANSFIPLAH